MGNSIDVDIPYNFDLRPYQLAQYKAMDNGIKRVVKCWHRRAGKDLTDFNYMIKEAVTTKDNYWYVLPQYGQARKAIWENMTKDGRRYLSYIPDAIIKRKREQDMMIELINGSIIRLLGGDDVDTLVGAGPRGVVMSEYSLHKPSTWHYLEPMIIERNGWVIFNGTPRGHNHFYDLMEMAKGNPDWFWQICTVDDTGVVSEEAIQKMRDEGKPEENIQQEYYCSFQGSIHGSYYGPIIADLEKNGQVSDDVLHDVNLQVHTHWDLGMRDSTAIWFYQQSANQIRVIDYYECSGEGLQHYIQVLESKRINDGYKYGRHYGPHDIKVRELGTGKSRLEVAASLGLIFDVAKSIPVVDGIDAVRSVLPRCWFNKKKTKMGFEALKQYRKEYDEKNKCFKSHPLHDWTSHAADAFRGLAISADSNSNGSINYYELY